MRARLVVALAILFVCLAGCGARTGLGESSGEAASTGGGAGAGGGGPDPRRCPAWVKTRDAVQVSNIASIVEAQALVATPEGALVGYADAQFPPVDSSWHARSISFVDGALGADHQVLARSTSGLGWTKVSFAVAAGRAAATASDDTQGMQFVEIDPSGAPTTSPASVPGDPARFMLATSGGYSVLRSPFDPSGGNVAPVSLSSLDAPGQATMSTALRGAATPRLVYHRVRFDDGSFALVWSQAGGACKCTELRAWHFGEDGHALSAAATLYSFGTNDFGSGVVAASSNRLLLFRTSQQDGMVSMFGAPFDANGQSLGTQHRFAMPGQANAPTLALAAAPGGDFLAVWADGDPTTTGHVHVQSLRADGSSEGPPSVIAEGSLSTDSPIFVVVSGRRAMVLYAADVPGFGIEAFAVPLRCAS